MTTDKKTETFASLEGLKTIPFCKVFEVAGHQIMFTYERTALEVIQKAAIYVPWLGRVEYSTKRPCDSEADAQRWLDSLNQEVARKSLSFLHGKIKDIPKHG